MTAVIMILIAASMTGGVIIGKNMKDCECLQPEPRAFYIEKHTEKEITAANTYLEKKLDKKER